MGAAWYSLRPHRGHACRGLSRDTLAVLAAVANAVAALHTHIARRERAEAAKEFGHDEFRSSAATGSTCGPSRLRGKEVGARQGA